MPGTAEQGINDRIPNFQYADQIVTIGANGTATILNGGYG